MKKIFILTLAIIFCHTICAAQPNFSTLEDKYNAVLGVYAIDTNDNKIIEYNADLRFAYCSTHKVFTVAELLRKKVFKATSTD